MRLEILVVGVLALVGCDDRAQRPAGLIQPAGITTATDTGEGDSGGEAPGPKLDLPDDWDQTTGGKETTDGGDAEGTTGGETADTQGPTTGASSSGEAQSTGAGDETSSTGDELSTTGDESTAGESSTGSTGGESSSGSNSTSGEPEPEPEPVCGDGVCGDSEHANGCWSPGWCKPDCAAAPVCESDCPCEPGITNWCDLAPGTCDATTLGGACDPNGDGAYFDGDWTAAWQSHQQKCG